MSDKPKITKDDNPTIMADALGMKICELFGIDHNKVARVVIDLPAGNIAKVTIERWGTADMLGVDWADLKHANVEEVEA